MADDDSRSPLLDITVVEGACTVLRLDGDLDPSTAPRLQAAIESAAETAGIQQVTIDLGGVGFLDSSGLRVFVTGRELLRQRGAELALRDPSPNVVRLLDITGLGEIISVE